MVFLFCLFDLNVCGELIVVLSWVFVHLGFLLCLFGLRFCREFYLFVHLGFLVLFI